MKNIFYNSLLIFAILVLFGCGHSNGINANTQKSNIDTMENKLVAMGYQNLFQFGDRSEMYEIWQNGDNQKSVEAIITNPKSSFHAKFLAAEILRRFEIKISSKYDAVLSKSYIYALEHSSMEDNNFKERVKTIKENIPKFDAIINQKYKIYLIEYRKFEAKKAQITARFNNKTLTRKEAEEEIEIAEEPKKIAYSDWDYNLNQKAEHIWSIYNEQLDKWKDDVDEKLGINQYANPDVGQGYTTSSGGEKYSGVMTWNYHWGGVILKSDDNKDNVVLENYATVPGDENRDWKFKMYGTEKGQTFHDFHKNEKQHGKTPTTMVIEKG